MSNETISVLIKRVLRNNLRNISEKLLAVRSKTLTRRRKRRKKNKVKTNIPLLAKKIQSVYISNFNTPILYWWMNSFCGMADGRKAVSLVSKRNHCQRSSSSRISDMPRTGFEPAQNLSSGFVEWSYALVITTTTRRQKVAVEVAGIILNLRIHLWVASCICILNFC